MTLRDYLMYWYRTYRMPHQQKNTQASYISMLQNHIFASSLADKELKDITVQACQEFLTYETLHGNRLSIKHLDKSGTPLSAHSVRKLRQILISAFRQAVKEQLISYNVAENTEVIPLPWKDSPIFTPEMQKRFLQAVRNHRYYAAYILLFFLGCRRSEVLGLSWDCIDFRRNIVKIRQALILENGKIVLRAKTKTKASIRTIPITKEIKYILQDWKQQQKAESHRFGYKNKYNLVFTNRDGSPHNPAYFSRNFKNVIKKLGFSSELHLHSARHTWATNLIRYGISISDVQSLGGWSRPDTLLNIYAHSVKESQRKAIKKLYNELNK